MIKKIIGWLIVSQMFPLTMMYFCTIAWDNGYQPLTSLSSSYMEGYIMGWGCNVFIAGISLIMWLALKLILKPENEEQI